MRLDSQNQSIRTRAIARAPRALAAIVGVAGALSLSACGLLPNVGTDQPCGSAAASCVQVSPSTGASDDPDVESTMGADPTEAVEEPKNGDADDSGEGDSQTTAGPREGEPRTESLAGDDSIEVDEDGSGVVPAAALEADIEDLFVNRYGIEVTGVECFDDMQIYSERGSQNCDIHTEERTYFGTIGVRGFDGEMVKYELYFPGLDEGKLDL